MSERNDKDYAIEHGEYLAKAVESFMGFINATGMGAHAPDQNALTDHWRRLQADIYEFRKRAAKATAPYEFDAYGEAEQAGMLFAVRVFGEEIAGIKNWEGGDGSETVAGDVEAEFYNIARAAGWVNADGDPVFGANASSTSKAAR